MSRAHKSEASEQARETFKTPVFFEQNKLGKTREQYTQLRLFPTEEETEPAVELSTIGANLSVNQDKALSAIQYFFSQTNYEGNLEPDEVTSHAFGYKGELPRMLIKPKQFLEAYGIPGGKNKGRKAEEALSALYSLSENFSLVITKKNPQGKKDAVVISRPLITIDRAYSSLDNEEIAELIEQDNSSQIARATGLVITLSPLLIKNVDTFYIEKRLDQFKLLEDALAKLKGGRRAKLAQAHKLIIDLLQTYDLEQVRINEEKLIYKLRLGSWYETRQKKRVNKRLQECFELAQEAGFIFSYSQWEAGEGWEFELNPEHFSRVQSKKKKELRADNK